MSWIALSTLGDFTLYSAEDRRVTFADPSGGVADAAGDFDALVRRHRSELPILGNADTYEDVDFTSQQAVGMEVEIAYLLERESEMRPPGEVHPGAARRGLLRFREMARRCAAHEGSRITWSGE
jgi:hypothetical protein